MANYGFSPNGGLINETNEQYYVGHQAKVSDGVSTTYQYTFDEVLKMGVPASPLSVFDDSTWNINDPNFALNNFDLMISTGGLDPYVLWDGSNGGVAPPPGEVFGRDLEGLISHERILFGL